MADVIVINKIDTADFTDIITVGRNVQNLNPQVVIVEAASPIFVENPQEIRGKRVLVVEDGPTLTHGGMSYGAGTVAAKRLGAAEIVDPGPYAVGSIMIASPNIPPPAQCCQLWGTVKNRLRSWKRPSTPLLVIWSSLPHLLACVE